MSRKRKSSGGEGGGGSSWMDTYGDMVTLLLTFFILLFAFSNVDTVKWQQLVETFTGRPPAAVIQPIDPINPVQGLTTEDYIPRVSRSAFTPEQESGAPEDTVDQEAAAEIQQKFNTLFEQLQNYIGENNLQSTFALEKDGEFIYLTVLDGVLFDSGKASLLDPALEYLNAISQMLRTAESSIRFITVEGHTDTRPINTAAFEDNWDLSAKRATNVIRYMQQQSEIPMPVFVAIGRGEWEPVAPNDTEEGRQKNRRVRFIIESKNMGL